MIYSSCSHLYGIPPAVHPPCRCMHVVQVLIQPAQVPTAAFASLSFVAQEKFGWGIHAWDVPIDEFTPALQASLASQLLFDVSTTLTKLSILALIWRVVSVQEGSHKYVVLIVAITVAVDGLAFFFVTLFQCR